MYICNREQTSRSIRVDMFKYTGKTIQQPTKYAYVHVHVIYIYIYTERERERVKIERKADGSRKSLGQVLTL